MQFLTNPLLIKTKRMKNISVFFEEIIKNYSSCSKKMKSTANKLLKSCVAGKFIKQHSCQLIQKD